MNGSPIASDLWVFRRSALLPGEAQDALPAGAEPQVEIQFWAAGQDETRSWVVPQGEIRSWVVLRAEIQFWAVLRGEPPSLVRQGETRSWSAPLGEPPFVASRDEIAFSVAPWNGIRSWTGQQGEFRSLVQTQDEMRSWAALLDETQNEALSWPPSEAARCCDLRPLPLPRTGSRAGCALLRLLAWLRQPLQACRDWR